MSSLHTCPAGGDAGRGPNARGAWSRHDQEPPCCEFKPHAVDVIAAGPAGMLAVKQRDRPVAIIAPVRAAVVADSAEQRPDEQTDHDASPVPRAGQRLAARGGVALARVSLSPHHDDTRPPDVAE